MSDENSEITYTNGLRVRPSIRQSKTSSSTAAAAATQTFECNLEIWRVELQQVLLYKAYTAVNHSYIMTCCRECTGHSSKAMGWPTTIQC